VHDEKCKEQVMLLLPCHPLHSCYRRYMDARPASHDVLCLSSASFV